MNYYNEFDPKAAATLRELISAGLIPAGDIDDRSIIDVQPKDLDGYTQHHFFAGIGGWSYALKLADWPEERPVWTASLPCQPFSAAGKGLGKQDERHLLPHFLELVKQRRPDIIYGEQVERAIAHGWLDDLQATMEAEGYAIGHCVLGAHSIGAAHIRQRLYWVGIPDSPRSQQRGETSEAARHRSAAESAGCVDGMGDSSIPTGERYTGRLSVEEVECSRKRFFDGYNGVGFTDASEISWIYCRDNKYRPVEPGILPLAHGLYEGMVYSDDPSAPANENATQEARVMRLKGYGNAIVPQVAAEFISTFMEWKE